MYTAISAHEVRPYDLIREVSMDAIEFYNCGLQGIYLREGYQESHSSSFEIRRWKPEDRLEGKFGRFLVEAAPSDAQDSPDEEILVMGTTIMVGRKGRFEALESLRHYMLLDFVESTIAHRRNDRKRPFIKGADYGTTHIILDENNNPTSIVISELSADYGRADIEGREITCQLFRTILGAKIDVVNLHPDPFRTNVVIA